MAQQLDETQNIIGRAEQDVFLPALEPARLEPPTHPALPRLRTGRLHFAPTPADGVAKTVTPTRRPHRGVWVERVFEAGWLALILGCAVECVYRLFWAIQP